MANYTLLDLLKLENGIAYPLVEENLKIAPELERFPAETIEGSTIRLSVRTDLPSADFRNTNEGTARSKGKFEDRVFQCHLLDHQVAVDYAEIEQRTMASVKARLLESHASGAFQAALRKIGSQFYYGTGHDAKGFPGLIAQSLTDSDHVVDATGTTGKTSVWLLSSGFEGPTFLFGNNRTVTIDAQWKIETIYDGSNNPYQAWTNWLHCAVGVRVANKHTTLRIKNVTAETGKKLTGTLLMDATEKFMTNFKRMPDVIVMNIRSMRQLRDAKVTPENPDPSLPTDWHGIPLLISESLTNTETI